jgi:hypothetical protein
MGSVLALVTGALGDARAAAAEAGRGGGDSRGDGLTLCRFEHAGTLFLGRHTQFVLLWLSDA